MSFCEALKKLMNDNNKFTDGSDFYSDDIGAEQDVLADLGLPYTTDDGVDLQYFLVQYKYSNSVDAVTATGATAALGVYIVLGSAKSAISRGSGIDGYTKDVSADMAGNLRGYDAARYDSLKDYYDAKCKKGCK